MRIVVDTSAVVAILAGEPERGLFLDLLLRSESIISAGSAVETMRTIQLRFGPERIHDLHAFVSAVPFQIVPFDAAQLRFAEEGMIRFGKGRGTEPAVLNFGDLFAYALARSLAAPLLFKGDDFTLTDITPALPPR